MGRKARLLADEDDIGVRELPARLPDERPRLSQQLDRVGARERRIAGREERADVLEARGAEHGIGQRVREHVAVRVPGEPARVIHPNAPEHERHSVLERMGVEARADAVLRHVSTAGSSSSESTWTSAAEPSCSSPHGPRRTCTANIPARFAGSTSLSTRSPTYASSDGARLASSQTRRKNSREGFSTPHSAEVAMKSTSSPQSASASRACAGWLPARPTAYPPARSRRRHGRASG